MIGNSLIDKIISMPEEEKGGDNALDGFEFQVSTAIYLMFEEIKNETSFALIYEKIEDFIIFDDGIHLYQAKSISNNLTPNILYKAARITKSDDSGLSIIEKMNRNYIDVKEHAGELIIDNNLIICENQVFSKKLTKDKKTVELDTFNFELLETDVKLEIINNTKFDDYPWCNINAIRLIPKNRHEEVTRSFMEDVINKFLGENKINSIALYNSLTCEIRRIRKKKEKLTYDFIMSQINKYSLFEDDLKYKDYVYLLNENDRSNLLINSSFGIITNTIRINNHPNKQDFDRFMKLYNDNKNKIKGLYEFFNIIIKHDDFRETCLRLNEYEIKALILNVIARGMN